MSFSSLIKIEYLKSQIISENKICLFVSYFDLDSLELSKFRIFCNYRNLSFNRLKIKQINRLVKSLYSNNVVVSKNVKNMDLVSSNLSTLFLDNLFEYIFFINYINVFYKNKINYTYIKINNLFFSINFLNKFLFKKFLFNNLNELDTIKIKSLIEYKSFMQKNLIKLSSFKLCFFLKIFLVFNFLHRIYIDCI